ncbi:MAG TPA: selenocysteine-specific translation elongation factor [Stellaceae bacterium]|nr:selenocysteine-specific translation elongation factor [Stellaceae bacterium]
MIVATAGHIDHGKTLLVKTLTGVDTDRLPEEKSRGMTIDLGFAYWPIEGGERVGFVDVPGHERFIRNMLAGVSGIDFVLLVVAADDGVMPQTREHAAILDLLGVARAAVALTKIDRVPGERVADVAAEITALLDGTVLADAQVFPVSAMTGEGIEALQRALAESARAAPAKDASGNFRLAVDRAFTVTGAGLVVTGAVFSGAVSIGDTVRALGSGHTARVRSIHAQNRAADRGRAGERCALNLAGSELKLDLVARGDWIVAPTAPDTVERFDARVRVLPGEASALAHGTPVHVHLGAAATTGRVVTLEGHAIAPGATALAHLALAQPIGAVHGDRLILRDQSARRTIGGGRVVDIFPPRRGRASSERLSALRVMEAPHRAALAALLEGAPGGLPLHAFAQSRNLAPAEAEALFASVPMRVAGAGDERIGFTPGAWQQLRGHAIETLAAFHGAHPNAVGLAEDRLCRGGTARVAKEAQAALAAELVADGSIARAGAALRLPSHAPQLAPADAAAWKRVAPVLDKSPLRPPSIHEAAASLGESAQKLEALLVRVSRAGHLVRLSPGRFIRPAALRQLAEMAAEVAADAPDHKITAARFRDRSGIGRNVAIEVLEYFDKVKFTRRVGDAHEPLRPVAEAFGAGTTTER